MMKTFPAKPQLAVSALIYVSFFVCFFLEWLEGLIITAKNN